MKIIKLYTSKKHNKSFEHDGAKTRATSQLKRYV